MSANSKPFTEEVKCQCGEDCNSFFNNPDGYIDVKSYKNNLCFLKTALSILVQYQNEIPSDKYSYTLTLDDSEVIQGLDTEKITEFEKSLVNLTKKSVLVVSHIPFALKRTNINAAQPLMYDVLTLIFSSTDAAFRQRNFHKILRYYYDLCTKRPVQLASIHDLEYQLKILLPIVKLETILQSKNNENNDDVAELIRDLEHYIKQPQLNREDCLAAVSKKLGTNEFELLSYEVVSLPDASGYLGDYFSVTVRVKVADNIEEFKMFAKVLAANNEQLTAIVQSGASKIEEFFYNTLLALFEENGLESILEFAPKCYFSRINDVLVLEDMFELGFRSTPTYAKLNYDEVKMIYTKCARFHASTFILEDRLSKKHGKRIRINDLYGEYLKDWIFSEKEDVPQTPVHPKYGVQGIHALIEIFPQFSDILTKEELKEKVNNIATDIGLKLTTYPHLPNVICHGDLYASNTMLRQATKSQSLDAILVDFQVLRYGLPVQDLLFLVYCNCDKEIRDRYLNELLDHYYRELSGTLKMFSLDIDVVYPQEKFQASLDYMKPVSLVAGIIYAQLTMISKDVTKNMLSDEAKYNYYFLTNRRALLDLMISASEDYTKYNRDLIQDLYQLCST